MVPCEIDVPARVDHESDRAGKGRLRAGKAGRAARLRIDGELVEVAAIRRKRGIAVVRKAAAISTTIRPLIASDSIQRESGVKRACVNRGAEVHHGSRGDDAESQGHP